MISDREASTGSLLFEFGALFLLIGETFRCTIEAEFGKVDFI